MALAIAAISSAVYSLLSSCFDISASISSLRAAPESPSRSPDMVSSSSAPAPGPSPASAMSDSSPPSVTSLPVTSSAASASSSGSAASSSSDSAASALSCRTASSFSAAEKAAKAPVPNTSPQKSASRSFFITVPGPVLRPVILSFMKFLSSPAISFAVLCNFFL